MFWGHPETMRLRESNELEYTEGERRYVNLVNKRMGNINMGMYFHAICIGITQSYTGTLFVEDRVAYDFLSIILEDKAPYI